MFPINRNSNLWFPFLSATFPELTDQPVIYWDSFFCVNLFDGRGFSKMKCHLGHGVSRSKLYDSWNSIFQNLLGS